MVMNSEQFRLLFTSEYKESGKTAKQVGTVDRSIGGMRQSLDNVAKASRGLTMQFLGLMFFGMMLQRTFIGFLKPAMEAFGVMDLWSQMLLVTFLPVMQELFPMFLNLIEALMDMDDSTKLLVGSLTVLVAVLGTLLALLGQFALGLGAIISLFSKMTTTAEGTAITISSGFLAISAIILTILAGIFVAWKENFGNMRDWFSTLIDSLKLIVQGWKKVFAGDLSGFVDIFRGTFAKFLSILTIVGLGVFRVFVAIVRVVSRLWIGLIASLDNLTNGWVDRFINLIAKVMLKINALISRMRRLPFIGGRIGTATDAFADLTTRGAETLTGAASGQTINITNNVNVNDAAETERLIEDNNKKVVDDLFRLVNPQG